MGNIFVSIPVPSSNGSGAPVDMSAFGLSKTISVSSFSAAVTIEISNELVPTKWAPIVTFNNPDGITMDVACRWMRATVSGYNAGVPTCDVGGDDGGTSFANLPATAGVGAGAAVDVSALPIAKTVTVGGPFSGNVQLEVSEDGITSWSQMGFGFSNPGQQSQRITASFMRVVRTGILPISGLPIVNIAACHGDTAAPPSSIQDLVIAPSEPTPFGPGANMPAGIIANWTQAGLPDHTNLEWRGADNEGTVLLSIDSTGVAEGAIRIFNNATNAMGDTGSVVLVDESDARVIAAGLAAPLLDRICTPNQVDYKVGKQSDVVMQRRRDKNGDLRWVVLSGQSRQLWMWIQQLSLYPHLQVGTPIAPIVGAQQNWNPAGVPYLGNADSLSVDGGNTADARTFTMWNVYTDAAGASVGGLLGNALNGKPSDWGPVRCIFNSGPGDLTLVDHDLGSLAENRLVLPSGQNYVLPPNSGAWLIRPYLDEGLGITVQWRLLGVAQGVAPNLTTPGRMTSSQITLRPEGAAVLPAGLTSSWNPGTEAVIRAVGTAPSSIVDGLVPIGDPLVGGELRLIKNAGAVPIVLVGDIFSASPAGEQFQLPSGSSFPNSPPPVIIPVNGEVLIQQGTGADGGKHRVLSTTFSAPTGAGVVEWITPAVLPAANIASYNPVDAVTGLQGRFATVWRLQGSVGSQLSGIDPNPPGLPPFVHGDRIQLINYASGFLLMNLGASPAGSQFVCSGAGASPPDYVLRSQSSVWVMYDSFGGVWIIEGPIV